MGAAVQMRQSAAFDAIADVGDLFAEKSADVRRLVAADVRAAEPVIDDACQVAWSRLVCHRQRVSRDTAVAWLVTTAVREALRLMRRDRREVSLEELLQDTGEVELPRVALSPHELLELRLRLQALRSLPERQSRLVWLAGIGLSYGEMAAHTGATSRTVERQLGRARRRLGEVDPTE